jgi:hypothetical protein
VNPATTDPIPFTTTDPFAGTPIPNPATEAPEKVATPAKQADEVIVTGTLPVVPCTTVTSPLGPATVNPGAGPPRTITETVPECVIPPDTAVTGTI